MATRLKLLPQQLSLPFEETLWCGVHLERVLVQELGRPIKLIVTDNRSVLLSYREKNGVVHLRLHRMFLRAPIEIIRAVARGVRRRRRGVPQPVRRFMNENLDCIRASHYRLPPLRAVGSTHNLNALYTRLNRDHFGNRLNVPVTWGRGCGRARRGGLTFGSYDPVLRLVRIHPVLDRKEVPSFFVESVLYHEMLHHHLGGAPDRAGRTVYHSRVFREAEARFPWHAQALRWEKDNLPYLLRASQQLDRSLRTQKARSPRAARRSQRD
ncbi:MAG: hypothetical protein MUF51_01660 [Vicinamibacteria bacterium]|jgi:hypothetical protein|nr:hypothetical protein [Vicinamibacteria bacterium]